MRFDAHGRARRGGALVAFGAAVLLAASAVPAAHAAAASSASGSGCQLTQTAPAPPGAPGTPFVTKYQPHGVSLEWPPAAPGSCPIASYQVYGTVNGATTLVATSTAPFVSIAGLAAALYSFQVTATDTSHAVSAASPIVQAYISALPPVSDPPCIVTYVPNNWPGGFTMTVTLRNEAFVSPPISSWSLTFPMGGDQKITSASNATVTQTGPQVTAVNVANDAVIPYNGAVTFTVQGTWTTSDAAPGTAVLTPAPYGRPLIC